MRIALAALFVLAAGAFADIAKADPYRYCADYGVGRSGLGATNCYFLTLPVMATTLAPDSRRKKRAAR